MNAKTAAEEFAKLQEAATKGPWREVDGRDHDDVLGPNNERICDTYGDKSFEPWKSNRKLIVAARHTALPRLTLEVVAENERLRELFAQAEKVIIAFDCEWPVDSVRRECEKLDAMKQALQEPSR